MTPGMVRHCQYVSHFSVCNDIHLTANRFVDSPFLEKDAQCTEEMTHIIAHKQQNAEQNRIGFNLIEVC